MKNDGNLRRRVENKDGVSILIDAEEEPPKPTDEEDPSAYHHSVQDNELLESRERTLMEATDRQMAGADNFADSMPPQDMTIVTEHK